MLKRKIIKNFYGYDDSYHNCSGRSSFTTNINGYTEQHTTCRSIFYGVLQANLCSTNTNKIQIGIQYLPFCELFVNQQNTSFDTRYKFTAKEHDQESNYTYFGARYYDADLSVSLSVDPMADKYPSLSPYNYCALNPLKYVDSDGMRISPYYDETGKFLGVDEHGFKGNSKLHFEIMSQKYTMSSSNTKIIYRDTEDKDEHTWPL